MKAFVALCAVYVVTAAPAFLPGGWRVIVQPAAHDRVEVYYQPASADLLRSSEGIGPFLRAWEAAQRRAETHPHDLAPPYVLHKPYRLVAPYVTARGRALAASPISGTHWSGRRHVSYRIVPRVRPAENSHAELKALMEEEPGPIAEPAVSAMGIRPELNRVVLRADTFDQELRRRLATRYGRLVTLEWDPAGYTIRTIDLRRR
ncbi:hypothetical protein ACGF0J_11140 [Nonomuraea sp. NPDC047897]|uniref:hypothetical protein n=1 Tax=Nonomuraea sp. NPDC047897 TaxID=3364346 RepID=UPI00371A5331